MDTKGIFRVEEMGHASPKPRTGWTVGAGVEWMLSQAWSIKAEYFLWIWGASLHQHQQRSKYSTEPSHNCPRSSSHREHSPGRVQLSPRCTGRREVPI